MSLETIFTIVNYAVMPFWVLLLILPHHRITNMLVHSGLIPVLYGLAYVGFMIASSMGEAPEGGSMSSLAGLQILFSNPVALAGGWVHYLVFDLFAGAWQVRDAKRVGIPHLAIVIPVILTFVLGPLGLLIYIIMRWFWKQRFTLQEEGAV